ncbi:hypothetical protein AVEN_102015-1 [Araneus ventricosus]|uniref:Uncharacterized protein n=1 Tax=Araneus ventricosus TaxID=182803 RepID=A0A4Y2J2Y8_ARAVE|nr:hypothetical protein AVEN_102015-1 [Araneus ventricosus]
MQIDRGGKFSFLDVRQFPKRAQKCITLINEAVSREFCSEVDRSSEFMKNYGRQHVFPLVLQRIASRWHWNSRSFVMGSLEKESGSMFVDSLVDGCGERELPDWNNG